MRSTLSKSSSAALLRGEAEETGKTVEITPLLVDFTYQKLQAGMARVMDRLPEAVRGRFLSSPMLEMERVQSVVEAKK